MSTKPREVNVICAQCGHPWDDRACGPTHAIIKHEIDHGVTVVKELYRCICVTTLGSDGRSDACPIHGTIDVQMLDRLNSIEQLTKDNARELTAIKDLCHDRLVTMDAIAIEIEKLRESLA